MNEYVWVGKKNLCPQCKKNQKDYRAELCRECFWLNYKSKSNNRKELCPKCKKNEKDLRAKVCVECYRKNKIIHLCSCGRKKSRAFSKLCTICYKAKKRGGLYLVGSEEGEYKKSKWKRSKDNLTDSYIANSFVRHDLSKIKIKPKDVPQELIELKRAQIIMYRAIYNNQLKGGTRC